MKSIESNNLTLDQIREQIARETGISLEDQATQCFEQAYVWLEKVLGTDPYGLEMLPLQPGFWPWWCTHWNAVDRAFVTSRIVGLGAELIQIPGTQAFKSVGHQMQMTDLWESYHDIAYVRGNKALMERSFHEYIKTVVRH